ncbi:hypothetical protein HY636_04560, partial [Candidatus Woesearchaeota archaeon]|nr:hypothetical protein [Candidatus Woesearchaeota archaeon]
MQKKEQNTKKEKKELYEENKGMYESKKEITLRKEMKKEDKIKEGSLKKGYNLTSIKSKAVLSLKRVLTIFKETTFYTTFKLFISAPKNILLMFLVDFIFLSLIMLINVAFNYMFTKISIASRLILLIIIPVAVINLVILILVYTFAKKKMLDIMFSYKNKISFETQYLKKFYFTNFIVYFI